MKNLSKCLVLLVGMAFLAPALQCGAGLTTAGETMACCRAMGSRCHKMSGGACCNHQVSKLAPMIPGPPASHFSGVQPAFTAALLPAAALEFPARTPRLSPALCVAHSPPEIIPLFLLHSTLLI